MEEKVQKYASELLNYVMREYSEDLYCAGWLADLEYKLWAFVLGEDTSYFIDALTSYNKNILTELARDSGGWWAWLDDELGEQFVPMDKWLKMYDNWKNRINA